jgi:hypothetical protein
MKKTNLVLRFNDRVVDSFASKKDLVEWFRGEGVSELLLGDNEGVDIEEGVDMLVESGGMGSSMVCWNEELVDRGDDYVEIGVYEIEVK